MRAIFTVFSKEFRENLRDRRTLFTALVFGPLFSPLLFAAVLGLMIQRGDTQNDKPLELAVSHTERAPNLVATLIEYGVTVQPVTYDDATARQSIESRKHRLVLMIPENYGEKFTAAQPAPLALYSDSSQQTVDRDVRRARGFSPPIARTSLGCGCWRGGWTRWCLHLWLCMTLMCLRLPAVRCLRWGR